MNDKCKLVVGIGEVLWDVLPAGKQLGGAPANFAYHASQLGFDTCAMSAIGDDDLGYEIMSQLSDKNMKTHFDLVKFPTGTVAVTLDEKGVPSYEIKEGVAWDNIQFTRTSRAIAEHAICICFGSLAQRNSVSRNSIKQVIAAMPEREHTLKVFDINLRQHYYDKELIEESIEMCNTLKINDEELEVITPMLNLQGKSIEERAREIMGIYPLKYLIVTCGADGSYVFNRESHSFLPTPKVEVEDTVGAGDSFTAAFCSSILKGSGIKEAHALAVKVSAYVCTQKGAMPVLNIE